MYTSHPPPAFAVIVPEGVTGENITVPNRLSTQSAPTWIGIAAGPDDGPLCDVAVIVVLLLCVWVGDVSRENVIPEPLVWLEPTVPEAIGCRPKLAVSPDVEEICDVEEVPVD